MEGTVNSPTSIALISTGKKDSVLLVTQAQVPFYRSPAFNDYKTALELRVPTYGGWAPVQSHPQSLPHPTQAQGKVNLQGFQTAARQCGCRGRRDTSVPLDFCSGTPQEAYKAINQRELLMQISLDSPTCCEWQALTVCMTNLLQDAG